MGVWDADMHRIIGVLSFAMRMGLWGQSEAFAGGVGEQPCIVVYWQPCCKCFMSLNGFVNVVSKSSGRVWTD